MIAVRPARNVVMVFLGSRPRPPETLGSAFTDEIRLNIFYRIDLCRVDRSVRRKRTAEHDTAFGHAR